MRIYYENENNKRKHYNVNSIILYNDESFGASYNQYFNFQVSLTEDRSFILNFDTYSKQCLSCEGYLCFKMFKSEDILFEKYKKGELMIDITDDEKELTMCEFLLDYKVKFDTKRLRICLGNINNDEIIMFGNGQYASFKNSKLIGIILDFKKI